MFEALRAELQRQWQEANPWTKGAFWLVAILQVPLLVLLLNTSFNSFSIDSMEYFYMHIIERLRNGGQIYVEVQPGHASPVYAPLYMWLSALLCWWFGPSLVWARWVSIAATTLLVIALGKWIWERTQNFLLSFAGPCVLLSTWSYIGLWMNVISVDALHTALGVLGFFVLRNTVTPLRAVGAGMLFAACTLAKQTGLGYVVAGTFLVFTRNARWGGLMLAVEVVMLGGVAVWLNDISNGQFLEATTEYTRRHPWVANDLFNQVLFPDLLGRFGPMTAMTLVPLLFCKMKEWWPSVLRAEYVMCGAGILVACISQPKAGSGSTQALIGYSGLLVCGSMGLTRLVECVPEEAGRRLTAWLVSLQIVVMWLPGTREFRYRLIDAGDREQYERVAEMFRAGRTCFYHFGYIPTTFGQPEAGVYGDESTMWKDGRQVWNKPEHLHEPFRRQEFDYVIVPEFADGRDPTVQAIVENYEAVGKLPQHPRGRHGGNARWGKIVFQAKRLLPQQDLSPGESPAG